MARETGLDQEAMNTSSPLDRPASIPVLRRLLDAKALSLPEAEGMEWQVRRDLPWKTWLDRGLLSLGVALIVAGIGYFFAHNWEQLTKTDKLGLAGGAVLLGLAAATWAGFDRFVGKLLLLAASALVGVFLAVFGQIYQTGAESYELFIAWAFLIFPWVALGRFMPLWLLWLALLNMALSLYWTVSPLFAVLDSWQLFQHEAISLILLNGLALLLREIVAGWPQPWFDRGWSRLILLAATVASAAVETIGEILHTWDYEAHCGDAWLACLLFGAGVVALGLFYSRVRYSLPALAIVTLGACTVLTFLAIRVLDFNDADLHSGIWLVGGVTVLLIFGGGVFFLRAQRLAHQPH